MPTVVGRGLSQIAFELEQRLIETHQQRGIKPDGILIGHGKTYSEAFRRAVDSLPRDATLYTLFGQLDDRLDGYQYIGIAYKEGDLYGNPNFNHPSMRTANTRLGFIESTGVTGKPLPIQREKGSFLKFVLPRKVRNLLKKS